MHTKPYPDFQFPQTGPEGLAPPGWQPQFQDHLYLAYTNVVAFSPTDTLPLTHRVKGLMAIQSMSPWPSSSWFSPGSSTSCPPDRPKIMPLAW
jgi:hypothetical protein